MEISAWTIAFQCINAVVLIWLLSRYLLTPVADLIAERQNTAAALLNEASEARSQAAAVRLEAQKELDDRVLQHTSSLEASAAEVTAIRQELIDQATRDARDVVDQSRTEISLLQRQSDEVIRAQAARLALEMTHKLFNKLPVESRVAGFLNGLVDGLRTLSKQERDTLANDADPVTLTTAYSMSEEDAKATLEAITHVLGKDVSITMSEDASLIAGMELTGSHFAVRNSFRADLAKLSTVLAIDTP